MRKTIAALIAVLACVVTPAMAIDNDVLYLSDTNQKGTGDGYSSLYRVDINYNSATLTPLTGSPLPYDHIDAIAAEPDGSILWLIDTNKLIKYDVSNGSYEFVGIMFSGNTDQAAMSPDGMLYTTRIIDKTLRTVNKATGQTTIVANLSEIAGGGDLVFDADGTLYMLNGGGLYELQPPYDTAVRIGSSSYSGFTGAAIRANGFGELVASKHTASVFQDISQGDGGIGTTYPMDAFVHNYGDMTSGPLVLCTKTIGYWKNHSWGGIIIDINGEQVDEFTGRGYAPEGEKPKDGYLWNAKGKTYSMLFAQLIAAKVNTNNAGGIPEIEAAEEFLFIKGLTFADFDVVVAKSLKKEYSGLVEDLTMFNEMYHCEDDEEPIPQ